MSVYRRLIRTAYRDPIEIGDLQVDGEDLAAAGVPKGPELGATLKRLLDAVIEEPARNKRDELLRLARQQLP
jgi:tRNA nucleotidyltransferase (CCA-adding enzyme)